MKAKKKMALPVAVEEEWARQFVLLQDEWLRHLAEVEQRKSEAPRAMVFEAWVLQKIVGLQMSVVILEHRLRLKKESWIWRS